MTELISQESQVNEELIPDEASKCAREIWDYLVINRDPFAIPNVDAVVALGSSNLKIPEHAARLINGGLARVLICSGSRGLKTKDWISTEAVTFADVAREHGCCAPIYIEDRSTNTGDNILFSYQKLQTEGEKCSSWVLVLLPPIQRRAMAVTEKFFPSIQTFVSSPPDIHFDNYPLLKAISLGLGELHRNKTYPTKGFQSYQEIPAYIKDSENCLIRMGFAGR